VLAVLERHASLPLGRSEVHVAVAGGVRVPEPGVDLAVAMAVASAATDRPVPAGLVACGEVGLGGELRQVGRTDRRLAEAARLGFDAAVVPHSAPDPPDGLAVARATTLRLALVAAGILGGGGPAARSARRDRQSPAHKAGASADRGRPVGAGARAGGAIAGPDGVEVAVGADADPFAAGGAAGGAAGLVPARAAEGGGRALRAVRSDERTSHAP
jgi:Lon protease (S16) C-terminal proteolytic domain